MQLYENSKETKDSKVNKILKISIISISIIIFMLIILIVVFSGNKKVTKTALIDGVEQNKIFELIQFENLDNNQIKMWIPIKEIAPYLGYKAYNGIYNSATEEKNKCYIITDEQKEEQTSENEEKTYIKEVANFEANSNIISKLDLAAKGEDYEVLKIEDKVVEKDGILYTTEEGIEKAFNIILEYDSENEQIIIYTLPSLVDFYKGQLQSGKYSGYNNLDTTITTNKKAILDGILIVKMDTENNNVASKYGAISAEDGKSILEAKYDGIKYIQTDSRFLIYTNKKYGMISKEGKTLIAPEYESLKLISSEKDLYLAKKNNLYGVLSGTGKEILYIENEQIGIDITNYEKNEIKSGYILLDKLIPVMRDEKWAFYDIEGKKISKFEFDSVGCKETAGSNTYGLLTIADYGLIVVQKGEKYSFINEEGKSNILPFTFEAMYIKMENGNIKYCMQANKKEYNILKTLDNISYKTENNNSQKETTNNSATLNSTNEAKSNLTNSNNIISNTIVNNTKKSN